MFTDFKSTAALPVFEAELAEVIGRGRAIRLARRFYFSKPGCPGHVRGRLYVPVELSDGFVEVVGDREDAEALVALRGGEQVNFSACDAVMQQAQRHAIRFVRMHGARVTDIALAARCSEKTIRRVCDGVKTSEKASNEFLAKHLRALYAYSVVCEPPFIPVRKYARQSA